MKKKVLKYDQFINENAPAPKPTTTPTPVAPPRPMPTKPGIINPERPSEEDEPMAAKDLSMNQPATKPGETTTPAPVAPPRPMPTKPGIINPERPSEEDEPMAAYDEPASLDSLHSIFADKQEGAEMMDNILNYKGIEVEVPSETGSYMVDGKNLKTKDAQKAYDYVQAQVQAQAQRPEEHADAEAQAYAGQNVLGESKAYSKTRKFNRRTKK